MTPDIRPGQVWDDCDPAARGRAIRVDSVDAHYAYCTVVAASTPTGGTGHRVRGLRERLTPNRHGYRLAQEHT